MCALTFLFKSACDKFKPTSRSPHYIFKIRDLAQIFLGMQQCTPEYVKNTDDIVNLFTHECNRVIHDRLTQEEERREYFDILHNALRIYCRVSSQYYTLCTYVNILFTDNKVSFDTSRGAGPLWQHQPAPLQSPCFLPASPAR